MDKKKVLVKNTDVKIIFEKMTYGEVLDSTNLAKQWLEKHRMEISADGSKGSSISIKDANTGDNLCTVFSPLKGDVENIILKTKQNGQWIAKMPEERALLINRLADAIQKNANIFCQLEISFRGILSSDTKNKSLPMLIDYLQYYSSWAVHPDREVNVGVAVNFISDDSFIGFLGCILGPALAAGYNVILQTEPKISALVLVIIELAEAVGIPEGTLKLLPGEVGHSSIFQSEYVSVISSFGNINTDLNIPRGKAFLAITNSKSPMIIFNNSDVDSACDSVVDAAWGYQGLLPWSINTLMVQEDIFQSFVDKLKHRLSKVKMSFSTDKTADLSYPNDADASKKLHAIINEAKLLGIEVFQNSEKIDLFQPTLLIGGRAFGNNVIKEDDRTAVVTILAFRTASEAISLANNTRCGFGASVWTENIGLANEVARGLNVSNVWVNSHGYFNASAAFSPYKKSGYGIFGGSQGFYEFITVHSADTPSHFVFNIETAKKPESGLIQNVYKCPVGNDFHNVVMVAKKGFQNWSKTTASFRNQFLRTVVNEISLNLLQLSSALNTKQDELYKLIKLMHVLPTYLDTGNTITQNTFNIQSYYDPVGVIAIEAPDQIGEDFLYTILGSILFGNAVIILSYSNTSAQFCKELLKYMSLCNITPGVFNIITHCNDNVIKSALSDMEIDLYFECGKSDIRPKIKNMQPCYNGMMNWTQTLNHVTLIKNVWSNIGDSVL